MLQPVMLTPADSCLTYVLRRGGYTNISFDNADWLHLEAWLNDVFEQLPYNPYAIEALQAGDLLYWKPKETLFLPISIDEAGRILYKQVPTAWHFAIVEADGLYSDITRAMVQYRVTINVAQLGHYTRGNPHFVLRPKNLINKSSNL